MKTRKPVDLVAPPIREGCEACGAALAEILGAPGSQPASGLAARYRPVADLEVGGIFGQLASMHNPPEKTLCGSARIFGVARNLCRLDDVFGAYFDAAVRRFVTNQGQGFLLLPLLEGIELGPACAGLLAAALQKSNFPAERVIAIHDGIGHLEGDAIEAAQAAARDIRALGVRIAAGALHCPRSENLLWSAFRPEFALIEEDVLESFEPNLLRLSPYAALVDTAVGQGRRVIALGVDSLAMLKVLQDMKISGVAGDFIGKRSVVPARTLAAAAHKSIAEKISGTTSQPGVGGHVLEKMLQRVQPVAPETTADEVFILFERNPEMRAVAVVKDGLPIGLIARYEMVDNMARPYRHELYGRKPCTRFMDQEPLIVDIRMPLSELSEVLVNAHPRHLISGFIITDAGHYLGIGSVQDLVREVTGMQMEAAKYANPLSQLPGNVPINQHIDKLLTAGEPCAIAYSDLDHFKPFNDVYGYARGDDVIRLTARVLSEICDPERDFLGHVGGDDFVLVFRSEDWQARCERALRLFGEEILGFFSHDDVERGGYVTENRKGEMEFHALTSLSIGVTEVRPGMFRSHLEVSVVAAEVKKKAKGINGNSLFVNQRAY